MIMALPAVLCYLLFGPLIYKGPRIASGAAFTLGPLNVYRTGIILSAQITLKSNAILLMLMALVATMPLSTPGAALHRLRVPGKIVHLLLMTYRYIFVIEEEYQRLVRIVYIMPCAAGGVHSFLIVHWDYKIALRPAPI